MTFRPMLWPTLLSVPALAILIGLGNWQMDRLAWKEGLIAQIEAGLEAAPAALPPGSTWADADLEALTYTPAEVSGRFAHDREAHVYLSSLEGQPGYHVVTPLELATGGWVLIDRGFVPISRKEQAMRAPGQIDGEVTVAGILIEPEARNSFTPDPDLNGNIWYHRTVGDLAAVAGIAPVFPLLLDAGPAANPGGLPVGGQTRLELRNPHLGYAMTWYGLAATLVAVWLAFHVAKGRISLR